jgi:iron complex outermembrane receptor protein
MLYANVSTGFKAGGIDQGFIVYQPEKIKALALGAKSRLFDNTVQINGEAFHYKYDNFQAQYGYRCMNTAYCSPVQTYANRIVNAGNATVYGAELEAVWRPTPDDRIEANVAYLHSVFDKLVISAGTSSACATPGASTVCALQPDQILTDQPLANAPKGSGSLAYEHIFTLPNSGELSVRAGTHLFSPYWTNYRRPPQVSAETYVRSYH